MKYVEIIAAATPSARNPWLGPSGILFCALLTIFAMMGCNAPSSKKYSRAAGSVDLSHATAPTPTPPLPDFVWANRVVSYNPVTTSDWHFSSDLNLALGEPDGPDQVLRLGNGGSITLGFGDASGTYCIPVGGGNEFIVYSNAVAFIDPINGRGVLSQVMTTEVSQDGQVWIQLPYSYNTNLPLLDPAHYAAGLAGFTPTQSIGAEATGGDGIDVETAQIPSPFEACYVRLTDAWGVVSDYGDTLTDDPNQIGGAGVDAVKGLHPVAPPDTTP